MPEIKQIHISELKAGDLLLNHGKVASVTAYANVYRVVLETEQAADRDRLFHRSTSLYIKN